MYNTMSGGNVADKLGLGSEVRELKFGTSFTAGGRGQQQGSFHSVRYDFKPASVDTSKMATLDVGPNGQVTISMPNMDGNATTVFKGARKPYAKECVLIIDNDTGEVTLEKLTHNIQVKRTREEGGSKKGGALTMPPAPAPPPETKKSQPPPLASFKSDPKVANRDREEPKKALLSKPPPQMQHHQPNLSKRGPNNSPKPPNQFSQRQSPISGPSPGHTTSPPLPFSPSAAAGSSQESQKTIKQQTTSRNDLLSLTDFDDLLSVANKGAPLSSLKSNIEKLSAKDSSSSINAPLSKSGSASGGANDVSALSESSSGEDSSSSSSSESSDNDSSDMEDVPVEKFVIPPVKQLPEITAESSRVPVLGNRPRPQPVAPSMPTDLLCEDLQLSESGSDSE